jgi:hypothetical protein
MRGGHPAQARRGTQVSPRYIVNVDFGATHSRLHTGGGIIMAIASTRRWKRRTVIACSATPGAMAPCKSCGTLGAVAGCRHKRPAYVWVSNAAAEGIG